MTLRIVVTLVCVFVLVGVGFEPIAIAMGAKLGNPISIHNDVSSMDTPPPDPLSQAPLPPDGPPMGEGGVSSYLDPLVGSVHNVSAPPSSGETADAYFYDTPLGNYTFPKSTPQRMLLRGADGLVVDASWFDAVIPDTVEGESDVVYHDGTSFVSIHTLLVGDLKVAEIRTTFDFFPDRKPKASAVLTPLVKLDREQLVWTVLTNASSAEFGTQKIVDLNNVTDLVLVDDPNSRIDIGTPAMLQGEQPQVEVGWADAPKDTIALAGRIFSRVRSQSGIIVYFPSGVTEVDPTVFTTSTSATATGYSSQRKVVWDGERYWVFYDAGATGIAYRTTSDGLTWTSSRSAGTGVLSKGFDVDSRGPTVALAWYNGYTLKFRKGVFYSDTIAWDPIVGLATASSDPPPPAMALGTDGSFWVAGHRVLQSIDGSVWSDITTSNWNLKVGGTSSTFILPLSGTRGVVSLNGWVFSVLNYQPPTNVNQLLVGLYNLSSGQWTEHSFSITEADAPKYDKISAIITGTVIQLLYSSALDETRNADVVSSQIGFVGSGFDFGISYELYVAQGEFAPYYPSITAGPPGRFYAFWRAKVQTDWVTRNSTGDGSFWGLPGSIFPVIPGQNPTWISTPRSLYNRAAVIWRDAGGGCSTCSLLLGLIPLLDDFGASVAHPWARAGISIGTPLIGEFSDAVNAASGQLFVRQEDAAAPGRRIDLRLARLHASPAAFQTGKPMFYATNPTVPLGVGWEIGLPWIEYGSNDYVHLGDGQKYVIVWNGSKFENRVGVPFTLYNHLGSPCTGGYDLYLAEGTRLNFTLDAGCPWAKLNYILDATGQNRVSFTYSAGKLTTITDTVGRNATFAYYASGLSAGMLQTLSYAGRSVTFEYTTGPNGGVVLWRVTYPLNLRTTYTYVTSDYLVAGVAQPWGASTSYTYATAPVGTEATGYFVTRQDVKDNGTAVRSRTFNYALVNGWATSTNITLGDGSVTKGYQVLGFASGSRGMTMLVKDANGKQLSKTVAWYTPTGSLGATDVYLGDAANRNYTNLVATDNWGNPYYSLTALSPDASHETFASYGNADSQNAFRAPVTLKMTVDGKIQSERFERLDLTPWTLAASLGTIGLNYTVWNHAPPSMRYVVASGGSASAYRSFPAQAGSFLFTTSLRLNETNKDHKIFLEQSATTRVELSFASDGNVKWRNSGGAYSTLQAYAADTWYRVSLELNMASNATIAINENRYTTGYTVYAPGTVDRVRYQLPSGPSAMFVGDYAVARKNPGGSNPYLAFRVAGLVTGRKVELFDPTDVVIWSGTADGSGSVDGASRHQLLPAGYLKIYDANGKEEYRSPFREFWPGSSYVYTGPYTYPSGKFYANTLPTDVHNAVLGTLQWQTGRGASPPVVEESYGKYLTNGLLNATKVYHNAVPLETTYSRDVYGNVILTKDVQGKVVRYDYGSQYLSAWPTRERRSLAGNDVTSRATYDATTGLPSSATNARGYTTRVLFDALGRPIENRFFDLDPSSEVLSYDMETLTTEGTPRMQDLTANGNQGTLTGTAPIAGAVDSARDFDGVDDKVSASDSASLSITSSFTIAAWVRYDSLGTGTGFRTVVRKYDASLNKGYMLQVYEGGAGVDAKKLYLGIGSGALNSYKSTGYLTYSSLWYHVAAVFDDTANTVRFYLNGAQSGTTSGVTIAPSDNGVNLAIGRRDDQVSQAWDGSIDDVRVFSTALSAADIQALASLTYRLDSKQVITYNDAARQVTYQDEDLRQTRVTFDSLGRKTKVERLDSLGMPYSMETVAYNWQDLAVAHTSATQNVTQGQYDLLGRPVLEIYPDGNTSSYLYTDAALYRKATDANGHSREYYANFAGRVTKVVERWSGGANATSYLYDEVGGLADVTDPYLRTIGHFYDDLNRLTKTIYPDNLAEEYTYYDAGSLASKKGRDGLTTTYSYDDLYRLTYVDYPGTADDITYIYDANGDPTSVSNAIAWANYTYDLKDRAASEREKFKGGGEPDLMTTFSLSKAGDLTSILYPGTAFTLSYEPDEFHRAKRAYSGSTDYAQVTYLKDDSIKDITYGGTNGLKTTYGYDKRSRPSTINTKDGSTTKWSFTYTYDRAGNPLTLSGAGIPSMTYGYDQQDRLVRATGTGWGTMTYSYDAVGNRNCLGYGTTCTQDVTLRPNGAGSKSEWTKSGTGGANWDRVDEADPADNDTTYVYASITGKTDLYALPDLTQPGPINSVTVVADARTVWSSSCAALGCYSQLKLRVNGYASPAKDLDVGYLKMSQTWTKNPATGQNWTQAQVNALEAGIENIYLSAATRVTQVYVVVNVGNGTNYVYGLMNELVSTTGIDAANYTYDANGNMATKLSSGVTWTYSYNAMGLLKEVKIGASSVAQYFYDGLGRRAKAVENGVTTFFVYGLGIDPIYEKSGSTETRYVYVNGMRIARIVVGGATYYYHTDALGSTWRITDASKNVVLSTSYEPFGRSWGTSGSLASTERYRFVGERNDTESGLVYLRARQYDPKTGRFTGMDPVLGSLGAPQTLNRYPYVGNNPTGFTDPTGECFWDACIVEAIIIGALIGAVIGGATYAVTTPREQWTLTGFGTAVGIGALGGAVAGATFGVGAWAVGGIEGGAWALGGIGYGGMFLLGGASSFAAYHAEVGAVWAATGQNTWTWQGAVGSFVLGGLFAMGGKAFGSFLRGRIVKSWLTEFDRAYAATEAELGARPTGPGASAWSTRLHANFQENVNGNLFLRLMGVRAPVRVNDAGPDATWPSGKAFFEVTRYGQLWEHLNRASFQPYLDAGWTPFFLFYS